MPNWCSNHIEINGPAEKLSQVWENAKQSEGLLEAITPIGEWGYHDAVSSWGTKWDVEIEGLEYSEWEVNGEQKGCIEGYFDSAWSPPTEAVCSFLEKNPDCEAELFYYEGGNDFAGSLNSGDFSVSDVGSEFFITDPLGQDLDSHFDIAQTLIEYEEELLDEALSEPITLTNPEEEPYEENEL
jgi:hypothetical protein